VARSRRQRGSSRPAARGSPLRVCALAMCDQSRMVVMPELIAESAETVSPRYTVFRRHLERESEQDLLHVSIEHGHPGRCCATVPPHVPMRVDQAGHDDHPGAVDHVGVGDVMERPMSLIFSPSMRTVSLRPGRRAGRRASTRTVLRTRRLRLRHDRRAKAGPMRGRSREQRGVPNPMRSFPGTLPG